MNSYSPPFISSISLPPKASKGEEIILIIAANWPNPAWKLIDTKTSIDESSFTAQILLQGQRGKGMAMAVLKPVTFEIKLLLPEKGIWKIEVLGRDGTKTTSIEIM